MSMPRKFPAVSWLFVVVLCPVALAAGGHEATPQRSTEARTEQTPAAAFAVPQFPAANYTEAVTTEGVVVAQAKRTSSQRKPTDFCLPGEKLVCTLGPPPVCHCE